jgi:hypothetical protein
MESLTIDEAMRFMFEALANHENRTFQLGIVGYFIEGIPYTADGLVLPCQIVPFFPECFSDLI